MGAIRGFNPDANGDGYISKKELEAMKKIGLDTSYLDKDGDGEVDKGVSVKPNSIFVGNEEHTYTRANSMLETGENTVIINETIAAKDGTFGSRMRHEVSKEKFEKAYEGLAEAPAETSTTQGTIKDGKAEIGEKENNAVKNKESNTLLKQSYNYQLNQLERARDQINAELEKLKKEASPSLKTKYKIDKYEKQLKEINKQIEAQKNTPLKEINKKMEESKPDHKDLEKLIPKEGNG